MKGRALQEKGERGQWREREGMKREGEGERGWRAESRDKQQERFPPCLSSRLQAWALCYNIMATPPGRENNVFTWNALSCVLLPLPP